MRRGAGSASGQSTRLWRSRRAWPTLAACAVVPVGSRVRTSDARARPLARSARALACTALLFACAAPTPPADPDGTPESAQAIEIAPRADALRCEADAKPDCADWFRFRVTGDGALRVSVAPIAPAAGGSPSGAPFELAIAEASGTEIGRAKVGPGSPIASIPIAADRAHGLRRRRDAPARRGRLRVPARLRRDREGGRRRRPRRAASRAGPSSRSMRTATC